MKDRTRVEEASDPTIIDARKTYESNKRGRLEDSERKKGRCFGSGRQVDITATWAFWAYWGVGDTFRYYYRDLGLVCRISAPRWTNESLLLPVSEVLSRGEIGWRLDIWRQVCVCDCVWKLERSRDVF